MGTVSPAYDGEVEVTPVMLVSPPEVLNFLSTDIYPNSGEAHDFVHHVRISKYQSLYCFGPFPEKLRNMMSPVRKDYPYLDKALVDVNGIFFYSTLLLFFRCSTTCRVNTIYCGHCCCGRLALLPAKVMKSLETLHILFL